MGIGGRKMNFKAGGGKNGFELSLEIAPIELESRYAHLHHADALRLLERGRLAFMEHLGFPNEGFLAVGLLLVIARIDVSYLRELRAERVIVSCRQPSLEGKVIIIQQAIFNQRRKLAVEANVSSVFIDSQQRRSIEVPQDFSEAIRLYALNEVARQQTS